MYYSPDVLSYEHPVYSIGTIVYINPQILEIHPLSPIAGQCVTVCRGHYSKNLECIEHWDHNAFVPCKMNGGHEVYYVEECYVDVKQRSKEEK